MRILSLTTDHYRVPLPKRQRIPLAGVTTSPQSGATAVDVVVVTLTTEAGAALGFTTLAGPGAASVRALIETEVAPLVVGESAHDTERLLSKAEFHFRDIGFAGPASRAYSAVDVALWNAKSSAAGVPLSTYLGGARAGSPFFTSEIVGTSWDAEDATKAAKAALKVGAMGVRLEIGTANVEADADRARELHDAVGEDAWIGLAAGGRYDLNTALALAHFFQDQGIDWFEDPINPADATGYARLADKLEIPLAVGSTFDRREDFTRVSRDGLARILRPDLGKVGGITALLKIAAVAEAHGLAVCPVRMPEITAHLGAALPAVTLIDRVSWCDDLFTGGPTIDAGKLAPPTTPGLGIALNDAAAKYKVA